MKLVGVDTGATRRTEPWLQIEYVTAGGIRTTVNFDQAHTTRFEDALLARAIPSRKGQTHTPGTYWYATSGIHIEYESNLERQWLTLLDFDTSIDKVAAQPLRFNGPVGDSWLDHVPDYFARLASGGGCVVDVKHPHFVDNDPVREQRELTAKVCAELGFEYRYLAAIDKQRWANVSWLSGFRRPLLAGADHVERLLHIANTPTRLDALCSFGEHPAIVRPIVFHLCWKQQLMFDLGRPLRDDTLITRGNQ